MRKKSKPRYENRDPSVTEVLDILEKDWMFWWIKNKGFDNCEEIKKSSQQIGHKVHKGIERFLRGKSFSEASEGLDNQQILMLLELTGWCNKVKLKPITIEERMHSGKYKFNGTADIIGTFNGGKTLAIIDWKTDSTPRDAQALRSRLVKYRYQAAGYSLLYKEKYGVEIGKALFVRVTKDKPPILHIERFTDIKSARAKFLTLRRIYRELKGR